MGQSNDLAMLNISKVCVLLLRRALKNKVLEILDERGVSTAIVLADHEFL